MGVIPSQKAICWDSRTVAPPGNLAGLRRIIGLDGKGMMLETVNKQGRYSIFATDPVCSIYSENHRGEDPFKQLADHWRPWYTLAPVPDLPFVGGWIGFVGYEAGRFIEPSAGWRDRHGPLPVSYWTLFDTVLIHDALLGQWVVAGVELPAALVDHPRPPLQTRLDHLENIVRATDANGTSTGNVVREEAGGRWNYSRHAYLDKVRSALEYIRAGDIFQVNLARRFRLAVVEPAIDIYHRLCEKNPAAYAAYLPIRDLCSRQCDSGAVLSSSPELFLRLRGRDVTTRPIKGTRPRGATLKLDAAAADALTHSEKDRAELNMIIDLERNDLGRVCEYGSLRVGHEGEIEKHSTVFHRTATVTGNLRAGLDAVDLLKATFPGGSITGVPKVRAMQIIHELEPDARGPYCGAIGYVGLDGDMEVNLAIRTMTMANGIVDVMVGSGIVADSDPEDEYQELEAKAAGMLAALGVSTGHVSFDPSTRDTAESPAWSMNAFI